MSKQRRAKPDMSKQKEEDDLYDPFDTSFFYQSVHTAGPSQDWEDIQLTNLDEEEAYQAAVEQSLRDDQIQPTNLEDKELSLPGSRAISQR